MKHVEGPQMVTIGAVSEAIGVPPSTLRQWEQEGLIPPATRVGSISNSGRRLRVYAESELEAIRLIAEGRRRQRKEAPALT